MRFNWGASIVAAAMLLGTGCFVPDGQGYNPGYAGGGYAAPSAVVVGGAPGMVDIQPGVQVVQADYDYPVFYSDSLYWRYDGGIWYSSRWHDRGWATSYNVPARVRGIDRPYGYAHYRGGNAGYRGGYNGYRGGYGGNGGYTRVNGTGRTYTAPHGGGSYRPAPARATSKHR